MRPHSSLYALITKAAESLLLPRISPSLSVLASDSFLQMRVGEVPGVREAMKRVGAGDTFGDVVLEVGIPGAAGMIVVERWEFRFQPAEKQRQILLDESTVYKHASLALRAITTLSTLLPAVHSYRNQLQYKLTTGGQETPWPEGASVKSFPGKVSALCHNGVLSVGVGYRDPLPSPLEISVFPPSSSPGVIASGSRSSSPRTRPRLQSSGNLAAIAAKCTSAVEAGYLPLCVSLTDDQDLYRSGSESGDEMELVIEFEGEEQMPETSAAFRRACKEAQDLKLFSSTESLSLRLYLSNLQQEFCSLLKVKEQLSKPCTL